ncbi:MAG: hypothetical protein AB7F85_12655, partial [Hyphomonadaceae bacterium]
MSAVAGWKPAVHCSHIWRGLYNTVIPAARAVDSARRYPRQTTQNPSILNTPPAINPTGLKHDYTHAHAIAPAQPHQLPSPEAHCALGDGDAAVDRGAVRRH